MKRGYIPDDEPGLSARDSPDKPTDGRERASERAHPVAPEIQSHSSAASTNAERERQPETPAADNSTMAARLPSTLARRPTTPLVASFGALTPQTATATASVLQQTQTRNANIIRRPKRPYMFTQLVQLSDGSTYSMRTTSPHALYRSSKDTRNHVLWQPSEKSLQNVEVDEAGKLAAFRDRYGRGWDAQSAQHAEEAAGAEDGKEGTAVNRVRSGRSPAYDPLGDLISSYAAAPEDKKKPQPEPAKPDEKAPAGNPKAKK